MTSTQERAALNSETHGPPSPLSAFGRYRVVHQVGAGVLGPVFRGYDPEADRTVAIKSFPLDITPEQAAELAADLARLTTLNLAHPSIICPIAAGVEGSTAFLVQDYFVAESIDVALRQYGPAPIPDGLRLVGQLAGALDFAAATGVHHGALHPRDILVAPHEVRLTGLGVAEALERRGVRVPPRRPYTAPERAGRQHWGPAADVFSLAAIALELLTGKRPPAAGEGGSADTSSIPAADSTALTEVFARALSPRPEDRYPSGLSFAAGLRHALTGEPIDGPSALNVVPLPAAHGRRKGQTGPRLPLEQAPVEPGPQPEPQLEPIELPDPYAPTPQVVPRVEAQPEPPAPQLEPAALQPEPRAPEAAAPEPPAPRREPAALRPEPRAPEAVALPSEPLASGPEHVAPPPEPEPVVPPAPEVPPPSAHPVVIEASEDLPLAADEQEPAFLDRPTALRPPPPREPVPVLVAPIDLEVDVPPIDEPLQGSDRIALDDLDAPPEVVLRDDMREVPVSVPEPLLPPRVEPAERRAPLPPPRVEPAERRAPLPPHVPAVSTPVPARGRFSSLLAMLLFGVLVGFALGYWQGATSRPSEPGAAGAAARATEPAATPAEPAASDRRAASGAGLVVAPEQERAATAGGASGTGTSPSTPTRPGGEATRRSDAAPQSAEAARPGASARVPEATPRTRARAERPNTSPRASVPPAASPSSRTDRFQGALTVISRPPGAAVRLDGRVVGKTPLTLPGVGAGSHAVRLELDGYRPWSAAIQVVAGTQNRVTASLDQRPGGIDQDD